MVKKRSLDRINAHDRWNFCVQRPVFSDGRHKKSANSFVPMADRIRKPKISNQYRTRAAETEQTRGGNLVRNRSRHFFVAAGAFF
jgi:hypothetical protein